MIQVSAAHEALRKTRTQYRVKCFRIERADGVVFNFTSHNHNLRVLTGNLYAAGDPYETFEAAAGINASAAERSGNLEGGDFESRGAVTSDKIKEADLEAGLFDGAVVTEYLVDWRHPWLGPFRKDVYTIGDITYTTEMWQAKIEKDADLAQPIGDTYTEEGRLKKVPVHTKTSEVVTIITQRRIFRTAAGTLDTAAGSYNYGKIVWTTGTNAGVASIVKSMTNVGGPFPIQFELMLETPHDIGSGDDFTVDKVEFEDGFPFLPGTQALRQTPPPVGLS